MCFQIAETNIAVSVFNLEEMPEGYYQVFTKSNKNFKARIGISFKHHFVGQSTHLPSISIQMLYDTLLALNHMSITKLWLLLYIHQFRICWMFTWGLIPTWILWCPLFKPTLMGLIIQTMIVICYFAFPWIGTAWLVMSATCRQHAGDKAKCRLFLSRQANLGDTFLLCRNTFVRGSSRSSPAKYFFFF